MKRSPSVVIASIGLTLTSRYDRGSGRFKLTEVVGTFGVQAAATLTPASGASTAVRTVLVGDQALGPIAWMAPEVLAGSLVTGVTATPASDVYMFGGLMFEVLTGGLTPYHWVMPALIAQVSACSGW